MKDAQQQRIPFVYMLPVFIPFLFVAIVMGYSKAKFQYPHVPSNDCLKAESGKPVATREIAGTLQFTSGMFIVKDAQNHITALTKCGKVSCVGPHQELKNRTLKQSIRATFCGKTLISVIFDDGSTIYAPERLERR